MVASVVGRGGSDGRGLRHRWVPFANWSLAAALVTAACDGRIVQGIGEGESGSAPSAGADAGGAQASAGGGHAAGTSGSSEAVGGAGATGGEAGASSTSGGPGAGGEDPGVGFPSEDGPGYSVVFPGEGVNDSLYAAALDAQGRLVVGGGADGTLSLNGEEHAGAVLLWLSPSGELVQAKSFGSAAYDTQVNGIAPLADGSIIAVGTYRTRVVIGDDVWLPTNESWGPDLFVMKVAANGEVIWARHFGGMGYDVAESAAVAPNGNVYVSGYVSGEIDFGGGVHEAGGETAFLLTLDTDGGYVTSQVLHPRGDLDTWPMTNATGMALGSDGNVWLTGYATHSFGYGSYLTQVSPTGQILTRKPFGVDGYTLANDMSGARGGGALIVGYMNGTADFGGGSRNTGGSTKLFAARFGPGGEPLWSSLFGDEADYFTRASAFAADGSVFITGGAYGAEESPMLVRLAADGTPGEPEVFDAPGRFFAVCTGGEHSVYLAGQLDGPGDFGFGPVGGQRELVVVRLVR